jgi:hypothetical protein
MRAMAPRAARSVEHSAEPVVGWRAWRLRRDEAGSLCLQPAFRGSPWRPREPVAAECVRRRRHGAPKRRCTCGLYGFRDGSEVGLGGTRLAAVGQVSMWGRVVEHDRGYRAEFAYPARLRLVCSVCLTMGERPATPVVVSEEGGFLLPLCDEHARSHRGHGELHPAAEVQAELLSTYAVDLLPGGSLPAPPEDEPMTGPRWWRGAPGKGVVALLMASVLLRVVLLWAAVTTGSPADGGVEGVDAAACASAGHRWAHTSARLDGTNPACGAAVAETPQRSETAQPRCGGTTDDVHLGACSSIRQHDAATAPARRSASAPPPAGRDAAQP